MSVSHLPALSSVFQTLSSEAGTGRSFGAPYWRRAPSAERGDSSRSLTDSVYSSAAGLTNPEENVERTNMDMRQ